MCADCESHAGRFPTREDLPALQDRARELAADARAGAEADAKGAALPRDLVGEDVMPADILEEYVTGTAELPPVNAVLGGVLANEVLLQAHSLTLSGGFEVVCGSPALGKVAAHNHTRAM